MNRITDILNKYFPISNGDKEALDQFFTNVDVDNRTLSNMAGSGGQGRYMSAGNVEIGWEDGVRLYNPLSGAPSIYLDPDGDAWFGSDIDVPTDTSLAIFSNDQSYNLEDIGEGDVLLGDNSDSKSNLFWDKSEGKLSLRTGTTNSVVIDTDGDINMFGGTIRMYDENLGKHFVVQADGDVRIGNNTDAVSGLALHIIGIDQTFNGEAVKVGDVIFGDNSASKANVYWDRSEGQMLFRSGQTPTITIDTDGTMVVGGYNASVEPYVSLDADGIRVLVDTESPETGNQAYRFAKADGTILSYIGGIVDAQGTEITWDVDGDAGNSYAGRARIRAHDKNGDAVVFAVESYDDGIDDFKYIWVSGGGLAVGSESYNPGVGEIMAGGDILTAEGIHAGNLSANPTQGNVAAENNMIVGSPGTGAHYLYIRGAAGNHRAVVFETGFSDRWWLRANSDAESGSDAGSGFQIIARGDGGSYLLTAMDITRASGKVKFNAGAEVSSVDWGTWTHSPVGWTSYTTNNAYYKKIGKTVFVQLDISGVSNTTTCTITLPDTVANLRLTHVLRIRNNSVWAVGYCTTASGGTTLTFYPTVSGGTWTASNTKTVRCTFSYQTT